MARQDTSNCTRVTPDCPVSATVYGDYFTFGACLFFIIAFSLLFFAQLGLGFRSRTWAFTFYLALGTIFEVIGYIGRLIMFSNPYQEIAFILQILFLILAPTLVAAAISLTFKHIVLYYGRRFSFIKPALYPWIFVGSDFVSIAIQGIGGSVAASGTVGDKVDPVRADLGNSLLIAGVAFQVVNMVVCGAFMLIFLRRYRRAKAKASGTTEAVVTATEKQVPASETRSVDYQDQPWRSAESDRKLKRYIYAISVAYVAIIIRCIYRYV